MHALMRPVLAHSWRSAFPACYPHPTAAMDSLPFGVVQTICSLLPLASASDLAVTTRGLIHMAELQASVASNVALWSSSQAVSQAARVSLQKFALAAPAAVFRAMRADLRENVAAALPENFASKLRALSVEQLKAVCAANAVPKSGRKHQLIKGLVGVWSFGSLPHCPACMGRCIELQYAGGSSTPTMAQCKYMRGRGRPCGFSRRLAEESMWEVLTAPLRDSTGGDLARARVSFER